MEIEMNAIEILLRRAVMDDAKAIFAWRNAMETRMYSFKNEEIAWEDHVKWFQNILHRSDKFFLIGEIEDKPIGVLRFDLNEDEAEINIYLVPGLQGNGLGTKLLCAGSTWLKTNSSKTKKIIAKVMPENHASHKAFMKAGFKQNHIVYNLLLD